MDTDAQAFITAAGLTNSTQQGAINTLVTSLKSYGLSGHLILVRMYFWELQVTWACGRSSWLLVPFIQ